MSFNGRKLINTMKEYKWALIVGVIILGLFLASVILKKNRNVPKSEKVKVTENTEHPFGIQMEKSNIDYDLTNDSFEIGEKPKDISKKVVRTAPKVKTPVKQRIIRRNSLPPIVNIYTRPPSKDTSEVSERFAPYGRLLECELVMSIDSASTETPIIGIVTRDLYHAGKLIIPAGVEVHGRAGAKPVRDRIVSNNQWVFVWRTKGPDNGKELKLKGIALTKEAMLATNSWHLYDGSAGIRGEVIKADEMEQLLAYAADFVATFTDKLVQEEVTVTDWGQTVNSSGSVQDAVNQGVSSAVRKYADKLLDEINRNGYFVRCTGGTQFYIYIEEPIDMAKAEIAGSRIEKRRK